MRRCHAVEKKNIHYYIEDPTQSTTKNRIVK